MDRLLLLFLALGVLPCVAGLIFRKTKGPQAPGMVTGSILLCALAFNLTFFWQELWLVIPKALTPGLHPILYHNDHDWTGTAPIAELLQGTGAIATLVSGLGFLATLAWARRAGPTWRIFFFWMAFQGLFQSLTQLAIGTVVAGNDVGRALAYLHVGRLGSVALLGCAVIGLAAAGAVLARHREAPVVLPALASIPLIVPFRLPRDMIEVLLIPVFVTVVGLGWLMAGSAVARPREKGDVEPPDLIGPAAALAVTYAVFQFVLRPGVVF